MFKQQITSRKKSNYYQDQDNVEQKYSQKFEKSEPRKESQRKTDVLAILKDPRREDEDKADALEKIVQDLELSDKFERYADHFISMLIERHKNINPNKIVEPREVINATQKYKDNNDIIGQYVSDRIIKDESCKEKIGIMEIYNDFKTWGADNIPKGKKQPDRTQLRSYIEKIYGLYQKDGWKGFKIKSD